MKAASYILFVLAGAACVVVASSFFFSDFRARLSAWKTGGVVEQRQDAPAAATGSAASATGSDSARAAELEGKVMALSQALENVSRRLADAEARLADAETRGPAPAVPSAAAVPVPPVLALKLSGDQFFPLEDKDLFGLSMFSGLKYAAYRDRQFEARWFFFDETYATVLRNLSAASAFKAKETGTFFGKSFFLNADPADGTVRAVFEVGGKAAGFEAAKERYDGLKKLLLR